MSVDACVGRGWGSGAMNRLLIGSDPRPHLFLYLRDILQFPFFFSLSCVTSCSRHRFPAVFLLFSLSAFSCCLPIILSVSIFMLSSYYSLCQHFHVVFLLFCLSAFSCCLPIILSFSISLLSSSYSVFHCFPAVFLLLCLSLFSCCLPPTLSFTIFLLSSSCSVFHCFPAVFLLLCLSLFSCCLPPTLSFTVFLLSSSYPPFLSSPSSSLIVPFLQHNISFLYPLRSVSPKCNHLLLDTVLSITFLVGQLLFAFSSVFYDGSSTL